MDFLTGFAFVVAGWGAFRLLAAGRRQLRGEIPAGRREGLWAAATCALLAAVLAMRGSLAAAPALAAAVCALLGGLSGKPVPAAWFAAALLLLSLGLVVAC